MRTSYEIKGRKFFTDYRVDNKSKFINLCHYCEVKLLCKNQSKNKKMLISNPDQVAYIKQCGQFDEIKKSCTNCKWASKTVDEFTVRCECPVICHNGDQWAPE